MTQAEEHQKVLQDLADKNAKYLKLAFLAAILELRNNLIDVEGLSSALESGSAEDIMRAIHIDDLENLLYGIGMDKDTFIFSDEIRTLFNAAALASFFTLPVETQKVWNYNPIGERATAFIQQDAAQMARGIAASTKAGVVQALTRIRAEKLGTNAQINEIKQLIGLTPDQVTAVLNFKRQLETRKILGLTPPDDRRLSVLDQTIVREHMANGNLTTAQIDKMVNKYYESLLTKRALDIAANESMNAVSNGQQELWEQGLDAGVFNDNTTRKFWLTAGDEKVRALHRVIPGMNPLGVKINSMFLTPFGLVIGPGVRNSGFINCRCTTYLIV